MKLVSQFLVWIGNCWFMHVDLTHCNFFEFTNWCFPFLHSPPLVCIFSCLIFLCPCLVDTRVQGKGLFGVCVFWGSMYHSCHGACMLPMLRRAFSAAYPWGKLRLSCCVPRKWSKLLKREKVENKRICQAYTELCYWPIVWLFYESVSFWKVCLFLLCCGQEVFFYPTHK